MSNNNNSQPTTIRLNKFLAERLGLSRREADDAIAAGKVTIDGKVATLGARIDKLPKVCYNGKIVPFDTEYLYIALNKPVGYVCSRRAQGSAPTLYDLLPPKYRHLKTVGRLDKDSSGLILLTNDGDFAYQMTHPKFHKEKIYEVELDRPLEPLHQQMISDYGISLEDGISRFTVIKNERSASNDIRRVTDLEGDPRGAISEVGEDRAGQGQSGMSPRPRYTVILTEGRNRQIRRTFAALGYRVTRLHRVQFGKYQLSGLPSAQFVSIMP